MEISCSFSPLWAEGEAGMRRKGGAKSTILVRVDVSEVVLRATDSVFAGEIRQQKTR